MMRFVPDARKAANEMKRVTKEGGIVATCMWITVEASSCRKDSGMLLSRLTQELNDPGLAVMDHQARFQLYGPSPALRKVKQRDWLFLWNLVPLRIYGAFSRMPRDRLNRILVVSLRIADRY